MREKNRSIGMLVGSMVIFGTIGVVRRGVGAPSALIAMARGIVGALFLYLFIRLRGQRLDQSAICRNLALLLCSGAAMGVNWILLFEAYNYTTVATATLCYYMAPSFIILASPLVLGEPLTGRKLLCVFIALGGMVLVSGVLEAGFAAAELRGAALGLGAALLYAGVILMNKRLKAIGAYDRTIVQLLSAGLVMLPYLLLTGGFAGLQLSKSALALLALLCLVHTGLAYALYFGSMDALPAHTLALFSYLDPVVAVLLSALLLREKMTALTGLGAVLILGSAILGELPNRRHT